MTPFLILLAICSTDVTCSRTLTVPRSIERSLVRLGVGLVATYGDEVNLPSVAQLLEGNLGESFGASVDQVRLYVDHRRDGIPITRIARATTKLAAFALDRADADDSVELTYTLGSRGLAIRRQVEITEGQIVSRASFACQMGPQGRCKAVWFRAVARESDSGTTIRLIATVRANTGICPSRYRSNCQLVNQYATRQVAEQLDAILADVESEGRTIAASGHDALVAITRSFLDRFISKIGVDRR
jgi:hypothetical protein